MIRLNRSDNRFSGANPEYGNKPMTPIPRKLVFMKKLGTHPCSATSKGLRFVSSESLLM